MTRTPVGRSPIGRDSTVDAEMDDNAEADEHDINMVKRDATEEWELDEDSPMVDDGNKLTVRSQNDPIEHHAMPQRHAAALQAIEHLSELTLKRKVPTAKGDLTTARQTSKKFKLTLPYGLLKQWKSQLPLVEYATDHEDDLDELDRDLDQMTDEGSVTCAAAANSHMFENGGLEDDGDGFERVLQGSGMRSDLIRVVGVVRGSSEVQMEESEVQDDLDSSVSMPKTKTTYRQVPREVSVVNTPEPMPKQVHRQAQNQQREESSVPEPISKAVKPTVQQDFGGAIHMPKQVHRQVHQPRATKDMMNTTARRNSKRQGESSVDGNVVSLKAIVGVVKSRTPSRSGGFPTAVDNISLSSSTTSTPSTTMKRKKAIFTNADLPQACLQQWKLIFMPMWLDWMRGPTLAAKGEPIFGVASQRVYEWHGNFANNAVAAVETFFKEHSDLLQTLDDRAEFIAYAMPADNDAPVIPALWATIDTEPLPEDDAVIHSGAFCSKFILRSLFSHLKNIQGLPDYARSKKHAIGAVALAACATERALLMWSTGVFVKETGKKAYFSENNWGLKTAEYVNMLKAKKKKGWMKLIKAAELLMEAERRGMARAAAQRAGLLLRHV
ncbi:hypothetical protein EW146_g7562 [Bondarzewia mesenterica]|uniref:Uncharacterized protein n=1 Tax=Bondarzewia mesenterica TaxID=1095465 RepID=A0A4S4LKG1_9AGAM|nr:hypothetical protein EW146_g7562 [Bondarzewia mesenterica]